MKIFHLIIIIIIIIIIMKKESDSLSSFQVQSQLLVAA